MTYETEHDKLIAAARAAFAAARDPSLPVEDPNREALVEHESDQQIRRLEKQYHEEREANDAMRRRFSVVLEAVGVYGRRMTFLFRLVIALGLIATIIAGLAFKQLSELGQRNREAIRVSCTVISNAIVQSGAAGATDSPVSRASQELQTIYVRAIQRRLLTSEDLARVTYLSRIIAKAGGTVSVPKCDEIALHPERVKKLVIEAAERAATP